MSKDLTEQVRDDNLRLLLSTHEASYIANRLRDARVSTRTNAIVGGFGFLFAFSFVGAFDLAFWTSIPEIVKTFAGIAAVVSVVVGIYGLICTIGARLSLSRYKSYEADHEKFLKHYHRRL